MDTNRKEEQQRTAKQNRALHKYFDLVADRLNDAGLDMKKVLKPVVEIPWTTETVKEYLWRPVQKAYMRKESTTELTTKDIDRVYEVLNRHLAKFGITEPFPSIEELMHKFRSEEQLRHGRKNT